MKEKARLIPLLFLIFITIWLRLENLGYSDYHGDEIKAMWRPAPGQSRIDFLYSQKKGPTEFLVSRLVKIVDPDYSNEFLLRLPFALAGILSIYCFYRLIEMHFGKKIALYAALLLSINGIFVGLMRIAQYQSFVILFSTLALWCFSLASQQDRWRLRGIYLGVAFWVAAIFSHYDGIFIAPLAFYLLYRWYAHHSDLPVRARLILLLLPFALGGLMLAVYFVPYLLTLSNATKGYWAKRIVGQDIPSNVLSSSILIFRIYNPLGVLYFYLTLGALGLTRLKSTLPIVLWFALPWIVLEVAIFDPGTHIYTYLMPATILVAVGAETLERVLEKILGIVWGRRLNLAWLALLFGVLAFISHSIFVDHTPEYPFEKKTVVFQTIGGPYGDYTLALFGFPYYRGWEVIGEFVTSARGKWYYYSNEHSTISSFYIPYAQSVVNAGHYVYILHPQSFIGLDGVKEKARYWQTRHPPVKVFESGGRVVAEVYKMPPGTLEELKEAGY